jgi:hypothetical protein
MNICLICDFICSSAKNERTILPKCYNYANPTKYILDSKRDNDVGEAHTSSGRSSDHDNNDPSEARIMAIMIQVKLGS